MSDPMRDFRRLERAIDAIAVHAERYEVFARDLRWARAEQSRLRLLHPHMRTRLDDVESELLYLGVRAARPGTVVQVGCRDGWSTAWLLRALRDNGGGRLVSFDLTDSAERHLPPALAAGRWEPVTGDVREHTARLPERIDHLFLDAGRSPRLTGWCLQHLVVRLAPGAPVCVGGAFRPALRTPLIRRWLRRTRTDHFTAARGAEPVVAGQLDRVRMSLGLREALTPGRGDAAVFFDA